MTFLFVSCKKEIETKVNIIEDTSIIVKTLDGERIKLPKGKMKGELVIDGDNPNRSYLQLYMVKNNKKYRPIIPMRLPSIDILLGSTDPVKLESKTLGQNFGMIVMRELRLKDDLFTVTFHDSDFNNSFAEMTFEFEPDTVKFDEDKKQFLASYQKVVRKQRALIVKIDGNVDNSLSLSSKFGWLEKTLDHIVNYGGAALISPWAYARYSEVKWMIGDSSQEKEEEQYEDLGKIVDEYPVIDYFAFVHAGNQHLPLLATADELGLKKNQLRVVYTGACDSGPGQEWMKNFGAVAAGGQRATSASPLFQFTVLRKWVYGFNFEDALVNGYEAGARRARAMEWITFADKWQEEKGFLAWKSVDDMLEQSEILYSYTQELPANQIEISQSAILKKVPVESEIISKGALQTIAERNNELYLQDASVLH